MPKAPTTAFCLMLALVAIACASRPTVRPRTGPLHERVGRQAGLEQIVEAFVANLQADVRLKARFANADTTRLKTNMTAFLCKTVGDTCDYQGQPMSEAHATLGITDEEFDSFMEVFILSMNDTDLPQQEQNDLIDRMMAMRADVVGR
jgi:hemoglobin